MFDSLCASFKEQKSVPMKCGTAVVWRSKAYVLVHTDDTFAYLLSIWGPDTGEKYKVFLNEVMASQDDVCFVR